MADRILLEFPPKIFLEQRDSHRFHDGDWFIRTFRVFSDPRSREGGR